MGIGNINRAKSEKVFSVDVMSNIAEAFPMDVAIWLDPAVTNRPALEDGKEEARNTPYADIATNSVPSNPEAAIDQCKCALIQE